MSSLLFFLSEQGFIINPEWLWTHGPPVSASGITNVYHHTRSWSPFVKIRILTGRVVYGKSNYTSLSNGSSDEFCQLGWKSSPQEKCVALHFHSWIVQRKQGSLCQNQASPPQWTVGILKWQAWFSPFQLSHEIVEEFEDKTQASKTQASMLRGQGDQETRRLRDRETGSFAATGKVPLYAWFWTLHSAQSPLLNTMPGT